MAAPGLPARRLARPGRAPGPRCPGTAKQGRYGASNKSLISVDSALFFGTLVQAGCMTHSARERQNSMVTIRLTRRGATNSPFYHVVVTDSRKRQGGLSLENVGFFNPVARGGAERLKLDLARIDYWIGKGAQQSDRVRNLVTGYRKQAAA
jgi:small subunit ribosomal protein S16